MHIAPMGNDEKLNSKQYRLELDKRQVCLAILSMLSHVIV